MNNQSDAKNMSTPILWEFVVKHEVPEQNQVIREKEGVTYCESCQFVNGKKQGKTVIRSNNGKVVFRGMYQNNELNGNFSFYNEDGILLRSGTAQNNLAIKLDIPTNQNQNQNQNDVQSNASDLSSTCSGSNIVVITSYPEKKSAPSNPINKTKTSLIPVQLPVCPVKEVKIESSQSPHSFQWPTWKPIHFNPISSFKKMDKLARMILMIVFSILLSIMDVWLSFHFMFDRDGFICCMIAVTIISCSSFSSLFFSEKPHIQLLIPFGIHCFIAGCIAYGYSLVILWKQSFVWFWITVIASCVMLCTVLIIYYYNKRDDQSPPQHLIIALLAGLGIAAFDIGIAALLGIPLTLNGLIGITSIVVYGMCILYLRSMREQVTLQMTLLCSFLLSTISQVVCIWVYGMETSLQVCVITVVSIVSIGTIGVLITPTLFLPYEKSKWIWVIPVLLVFLTYQLVVFYIMTGITYGYDNHLVISNCYMNYHFPWSQHRDTTSIEYADGCCSKSFFYSVPVLANLSQITFGNDVFGNVRKLHLKSLNALETIYFGDRAFAHLKQITVGEHSLNSPGLTVLNISSITSLESVAIQSYSLNYARIFSLPTSSTLKSIVIEDYSLLSLEHHNMNNRAILTWKRSLHSLSTLSSIPERISHLYVASHSCNEKNNNTILQLQFPWLKELHVGADALNNILTLDLKSLSDLSVFEVDEQSLLSLTSVLEGNVTQDISIRIHFSSMPMITAMYVT